MVVRFVRVRYRRQIRVALGIGIAGVVAGALPGRDARATGRLGTAAAGVRRRARSLAAALTHSLAS